MPARAFARYDETARAWVWPPGEFAVRVGRSSADLRLSVRVKSLFFRTNPRSPGRGTLVPLVVRLYPTDMRACAAAACAAAGGDHRMRGLVTNHLCGLADLDPGGEGEERG